MPHTDPAIPLTVTTEPSHRVLAADPIPADVSVLEGMPGCPVSRDQMRRPALVLLFDVYVVQIRSEGAWTLPNHDDGSVLSRGGVAFAVRTTMDYWPQRPGRASLDIDGTLYVSNGRQAARYIPVERFANWQPTSGTCPGCGTSYVDNGDGPCPGGRSVSKHDGVMCPNNNRPPECTELDPCETCTQDADAEAEVIEASMDLRGRATDGHGQGPMDVYEVTVFRTEMITFHLPAASTQDAEERYLLDGDETTSETVALNVDSITRQDPAPA
ncbi:hypothetical protein [Streptomyces lydicus]|uniref:hypothetical protein n=1 Tax=Streptomyces lydicus TaxID=47763 RepID=UPI0010121644|nr:hypothetical protein [Streptomyces lydicus]MCZ1012343.1 hypothetical protein [Streptomyces lydicus]